MKKKEQPICPKCGSKNIMARIKTGELWCRRCGYIGEKKGFFKNAENTKWWGNNRQIIFLFKC